MNAPTPTWYAILGVDRAATPAQIKAAWRDATDKFEPGSGSSQFRLFNEAADVLLDAERRAAYDATLDEQSSPEPGAEIPAGTGTAAEMTPPPPPAPEPTTTTISTPAENKPTEKTTARVSPGWLVLGLAALTAIALVLAVVAGAMLWNRSSDAGVGLWEGITQGDEDAKRDAGRSAAAAAERALVPVLSYDYRSMEADRDKALKFLTDDYGKKFSATFDELLVQGEDGKPGNAAKTKTVVKASVMNVGVVDAGTSQVRVLAFVNQASQKDKAAPTIFQNRLVATMVKDGDAWLIGDIQSY